MFLFTVTDIQCTFSNNGAPMTSLVKDSIIARLKKPDGFKGSPLFADDRGVDPEMDPSCQIRPDRLDQTGLAYNLKITDFSRCGVLKRNVRI